MRERHADLLVRYSEMVYEAPVPIKAKPSTDEKRAAKLASIEERMSRWESKLRRAETALKKLRKQKRYYETQLGRTAAGKVTS